ncbi:MAG: imidazole glycerol phosphate synthase subunit HisH [Candidatus Promineifilaceae bacterium]|nr:imidazole glycerol phosphate synthase subunit HisH [Candidatus Promineifilaceae bacterium]
MMIALVDSGVGNLRSVAKALEAVGADVRLTADPSLILSAVKVALPGVGAFGENMAGLKRRGLVEVVRQVAAQATPLLGICVGMQVLFEGSDELGDHQGFGLLPGWVRRFDKPGLKVPQTGWNQITPLGDDPLFQGLPNDSYAYFNHSYYCDVAEPADQLATTEYGRLYASAIRRGHLYGVQFHPEKSQRVGLTILRNFVERCP